MITYPDSQFGIRAEVQTLNKSTPGKTNDDQRIADRIEALLKQLEHLSGDPTTDSEIATHAIDHRSRMLITKCVRKLQLAQLEMEQASTDTQIMNERAEALFERAASLTSDTKRDLRSAQYTNREAEKHARQTIATAEASALEVLESAIELADSYSDNQTMNAHAVGDWVSQEAGSVATDLIGELESQIVEIGAVRDDVSPRSNVTSFDAA